MLEKTRKNFTNPTPQKQPLGQLTNKRSNVILIGMPASGKSSMGAVLARFIGYGFLDLDQWIEKIAKKKINEIIESFGEAGFRKLESEALKALSGIHNHIIATGSGVVELEENWFFLKKLGFTVWIDCPTSVIARRLTFLIDELKNRPLLADSLLDDDASEPLFTKVHKKLEAIYERRQMRYRDSDLIIGYSFSTPEDGALRLKAILESMPFMRKSKGSKSMSSAAVTQDIPPEVTSEMPQDTVENEEAHLED